jgi:hypothetical protein
MAGAEQVSNDLDAVAESHGLRPVQRERIMRVVTGAVSGNDLDTLTGTGAEAG